MVCSVCGDDQPNVHQTIITQTDNRFARTQETRDGFSLLNMKISLTFFSFLVKRDTGEC